MAAIAAIALKDIMIGPEQPVDRTALREEAAKCLVIVCSRLASHRAQSFTRMPLTGVLACQQFCVESAYLAFDE